MTARLELKGITKAFPGTLANDRIDLRVEAGERHALLGENGAGKSTLVKIVNGVLRSDAGIMLWEGRPVHIDGPHAARALGIGMVFQHFSLFEALSVTENIALGLVHPPPLRVLEERIRALAESYGLALNPASRAHMLSVGERQRVEIVRCLLQSPKLLIMDEPTSVLTPQEVSALFATLRRLSGEGCSVLYISHKLHEIKALCERATILRNGRVVATCVPANESPQSLAKLMIGTALRPAAKTAHPVVGAVSLEARSLSLPAPDYFAMPLRDVSFSVHQSELLGIAGVAGNGQGELAAALAGERLADRADAVRIGNEAVGHLGVRERRRRGLAYIPEDRLGQACVPAMDLADNAFLTAFGPKRLSRFGFIRPGARNAYAASVCARYKVKAPGIGALAKTLSGGNLQKFVTGRELAQDPKVLIAAQPTWGLDAGAAADIHRALLALCARGVAVIVISQELDELFAICDRIAVMAAGRLSEPRPTTSLSVEEVGTLMGAVVLPEPTRQSRAS